jgi:hypothetical protein
MRRHMALGAIAYFAIALVQIPAVVSGIHQLTRLWWLLCVPIGLTFGSVPILGSLFGVYGAQTGWGWSAAESYSFGNQLPVLGFPVLVLGSA